MNSVFEVPQGEMFSSRLVNGCGSDWVTIFAMTSVLEIELAAEEGNSPDGVPKIVTFWWKSTLTECKLHTGENEIDKSNSLPNCRGFFACGRCNTFYVTKAD